MVDRRRPGQAEGCSLRGPFSWAAVGVLLFNKVKMFIFNFVP